MKFEFFSYSYKLLNSFNLLKLIYRLKQDLKPFFPSVGTGGFHIELSSSHIALRLYRTLFFGIQAKTLQSAIKNNHQS